MDKVRRLERYARCIRHSRASRPHQPAVHNCRPCPPCSFRPWRLVPSRRRRSHSPATHRDRLPTPHQLRIGLRDWHVHQGSPSCRRRRGGRCLREELPCAARRHHAAAVALPVRHDASPCAAAPREGRRRQRQRVWHPADTCTRSVWSCRRPRHHPRAPSALAQNRRPPVLQPPAPPRAARRRSASACTQSCARGLGDPHHPSSGDEDGPSRR